MLLSEPQPCSCVNTKAFGGLISQLLEEYYSSLGRNTMTNKLRLKIIIPAYNAIFDNVALNIKSPLFSPHVMNLPVSRLCYCHYCLSAVWHSRVFWDCAIYFLNQIMPQFTCTNIDKKKKKHRSPKLWKMMEVLVYYAENSSVTLWCNISCLLQTFKVLFCPKTKG